jgi:hypothetical protein
MNNAFVRFGMKCVSGVVVTGALLVSSLMAATPNRIMVTLPHAVTVGNTTLPSGSYTISNLDMADGEYFVIRSANSAAVATIQAMKITANTSDKTQIQFSQDGDTWRFDKMFVEGDGTGYQFVGGSK